MTAGAMPEVERLAMQSEDERHLRAATASCSLPTTVS